MASPLLITFALIAFTILLAILWHLNKFRYFKRRGIIGPKPTIIGNLPETLFKRKHITHEVGQIYNDFKGSAPFVGFYNFTSPYLLILDPSVAKQIMVKNFKSFKDNQFCAISDKMRDPVMGLNPFVMREGQGWKEKRTEVAVGMTQSKLKSMYPLIEDVARKFSEYIMKELAVNPKKTFDSRDMSVRYSIDTVATCIFAIKGGSFAEEESQIMRLGNRVRRCFSDAAGSFFSKRLMPQEVEDFFVYLMDEAIKHRVENNIEKDDFLSHIISLRKKKNISDIEMAAHGVTMFLDGYDTSSNALAPIFYGLARNQKAQEKLREEIQIALDENNGSMSYEKLMELPYLDQCFNESLRINPPVTFTNRECTETVEFESVKGHHVKIEKGLQVFLPILSYHHDPEYFQDPEEFIPERFNEEFGGTKVYKDMGVFIPFGDGPRICLGMRFAQLQLKTAIYEIVKNFNITLDPAMRPNHEIEIDSAELLMNVKNCGLLLNFEALNGRIH